MGLFIVSLSDVGEGVAEAELIEWHVAVGDTVTEDQLLGIVMTDKAAVEVPSSVLGKVVKLCADVGDVVAVGSDLIHLEVDGEGNAAAGSDASASSEKSSGAPSVESSANEPSNNSAPNEKPADKREESLDTNSADKSAVSPRSSVAREPNESTSAVSAGTAGAKVLAAPSVRQRARELGVDITTVTGSGPAGRIVHDDLDRFTERRSSPGGVQTQPDTGINVVKVVGMRRKIAEKMALSKSRIPHITIVEEVDVHYLEELRAELK